MQGTNISALSAKTSLATQGFAVVPDLFTSEDLEEVRSLMAGLYARFEDLGRSKPRNGWSVASDMAPITVSGTELAQPEILHPALLEPKLLSSSLFAKCQSFARQIGGWTSLRFDHVITKLPNNEAETPWHQDLAYSHTARWSPFEHKRLHFWVPLQDATVENGCLEFVPGSHLWGDIPHSTVMRRSGHPGYIASPPPDIPTSYGIVPAGGATIHNIRTLHRAGANQTDEERLAWVLQFSQFGWAEQALMRLNRMLPD